MATFTAKQGLLRVGTQKDIKAKRHQTMMGFYEHDKEELMS